MSGSSCYNCIYAVCDPEVWRRDAYMGRSLLMQCANCPWFPGRLQDVSGIPCRNYRRKPATPRGDVRLIPLSDGCYAYVDAADYEWLSRYKWHLENGYAARKEKGRTLLMHRQIMQPPEGMVVDHIDSSQANNCRFNLRVCTRAENQRNQRKHAGTASSYKGVFYNKRRRKWYGQCWFEGKCHVLPYADDEIEAARAYDREAVAYFGEFARLNFPEEWPAQRREEVYAQRAAAGEKGEKAETKRQSVGAPHASPVQGESKRTETGGISARDARGEAKSDRAAGHGPRGTTPKGKGNSAKAQETRAGRPRHHGGKGPCE